MTDQLEIEIALYIDNEQYGLRFWPVVPRAGDEILVDRKGVAVPALIKRVVWGTSDKSRKISFPRELRVSLECEWVET